MLNLIKRINETEFEVVAVEEHEVLAIQRENTELKFVTAADAELFYPKELHEVVAALNFAHASFVSADRHLVVNENKISEHNAQNRTIKLEGLETEFGVSMYSWKAVVK